MKLGFACHLLDADGVKMYPFRGTTKTAFIAKGCNPDQLLALCTHNILSLRSMLRHVAKDVPEHRMMRIGSEVLPLFTLPEAQGPYSEILELVLSDLKDVGNFARYHGIRLSFHPGQFTVLASHSDDVIGRALEDLEYHTTVAVAMGYGSQFQDFKINIHGNGQGGVSQFRRSFGRLSPEARNMVTVENDEYSKSVQDLLPLADLCPIVFDIHHQWIHRDFKYLRADSRAIREVVASWRGVRPVMHVSRSRAIEQGIDTDSKAAHRAHSDYYSPATARRLASFSEFDVMCEAKMKNLARDHLSQLMKEVV